MTALLLASLLWIDVPFVKQAKNGCGAASVAMVLKYWRPDPVEPLLVFPDAEQKGIYASTITRFFERHNFFSFAFPGIFFDLQEHLSKGRPLIVALQHDRLHYVVAVGLDESFVLLNDPADRKLRKMERALFASRWKAAGNWTLLAVPRSGH